MPKQTGLGVLLAAFSIAAIPAWAEGPCLSYEPEASTLDGVVEALDFPGPPNYESVDNGDALQRYWILRLEEPVCVDAPTVPDRINEAVASVVEVQLGLTKSQYDEFKPMLGKRVQATGTLMHGHTGYHKTKVLLWVTRLESNKR